MPKVRRLQFIQGTDKVTLWFSFRFSQPDYFQQFRSIWVHSLDFDIESFQKRVRSVHPFILVLLSAGKSATEKNPP